MIEEQRLVGHQTDLLLDLQGAFGHRQAQQRNGAFGGRRQTHQHFDGGGFPRAVGSQKSEEAPSRYGEREAIHGGLVPVNFSKVVDFDYRRGFTHALLLSYRKSSGVTGEQAAW